MQEGVPAIANGAHGGGGRKRGTREPGGRRGKDDRNSDSPRRAEREPGRWSSGEREWPRKAGSQRGSNVNETLHTRARERAGALPASRAPGRVTSAGKSPRNRSCAPRPARRGLGRSRRNLSEPSSSYRHGRPPAGVRRRRQRGAPREPSAGAGERARRPNLASPSCYGYNTSTSPSRSVLGITSRKRGPSRG